jgi:hypothetical protein
VALGQERHIIKQQALLESAFEVSGDEQQFTQKMHATKQENKSVASCFGYKHYKAHKFYAHLLKCLKDCYDSKYEQLNIDLNFFLLLKNELSLYFLRKEDNILAALKTAVNIYAREKDFRNWDLVE